MSTIYLDYNATTPVDSRVLAAMTPFFSDRYGNPSSRDHAHGWAAAEALEQSREAVAECAGAKPHEIVFTSGATEALNVCIKGLVGHQRAGRARIIVSATEHRAVLAPCEQLARAGGLDSHIVPVDRLGNIDLNQLKAALSSTKAMLVAIMAANNDLGTIYPVNDISQIVHAAGALLLCDMTQSVGKIPMDVHAAGIDVAAFSAHKIYGPKGVGALFVRDAEPRIKLEPLIAGGGQERGLRGGTLNLPGIVAFAEACRIAREELHRETERVSRLRNRLEQTILAEVRDTWVNGDPVRRIPNTSNIGFKGVDARTLIRDMHDIAVSTQAACSSGSTGPSHVLKAIGLTDDEAYSCIRFSLGRFTTDEEIDYTINKVIASVHKLRRMKIHRVSV